MKHLFDWRHVCQLCQVPESKVDSREVSRMCTGRSFVFFAGLNHSTCGYIFTSGGGKAYLPSTAVYDPALDYPDEAAYMAAVFEKLTEAETRPGLCPKQIDWAAHKAFLRELS
jgi:hypothetical protein